MSDSTKETEEKQKVVIETKENAKASHAQCIIKDKKRIALSLFIREKGSPFFLIFSGKRVIC